MFKKIKVKKLEIGEKKPKEVSAPVSDVTNPLTAQKKWFEQEGKLAIDVYQTNGEIIIRSPVAGVKPEDLDISVERDRVFIKGERSEQIEKEKKNYFYQECYWGKFSREIILPAETDPEQAQAEMKNGVLTVRLPKVEKSRENKVKVKT